jgi:hypothetical protein
MSSAVLITNPAFEAEPGIRPPASDGRAPSSFWIKV